MRFWHIIQTWLRSLFFQSGRESDLREELQFHLDREAERLKTAGLAPEDARLQALRTFGAVESTKEACRDARGTTCSTNIVRDIRFALRSFRRTPLAALTIVTTVGLGLGLVASVFTILNAQMFQMDEVRNPHELFAVQRQQTAGSEPARFTRSQYDDLVRETDVFSGVFATRHGEALIEGRRMEGPLVSGNYFQILGVSAARGRTLTPADDQPGSPPVMVLSHRTWVRHFASDPSVIDRTVRVNSATFHVVGVMPENFRGLNWIAPEFWAPLSLGDEFLEGAEAGAPTGLVVVGRLAAGVSRERALAELRAWDARASERSVEQAGTRSTEPRPSLVLEPRTGTIPISADTLVAFTPLFFAFGLILVIGCANVANLLFARGVGRQREIGVRLAIGASRRRVIMQLLTEGLLLALVSAALGFAVSRFVLAAVVDAAMTTFPTDIGHINVAVPAADWRVGLFLVAGAMLSTLFFALAPAVQSTRVELVRAIRGEIVSAGRPGVARDALVGLQVMGSALLLISAAIFLRSSWASATVDSGIRTANIVSISVLNEQQRGTILDAVRTDQVVASVAAAWPGFMGGLGGVPVLAAGSTEKSRVTFQLVSSEFFPVLGIELMRGRNFAPSERTPDASVAIISESVARQLWPGVDALGQVVRIEPVPLTPEQPLVASRSAVVIGVTRDVPGFRLGPMKLGGSGIYMPTHAEAARTALTLRVRGDADRARNALIDRFKLIDPNMAEVSTMQTIARAEAYLLGVPFWLTLALGALALVLTLSGLFSVLSYLVEQRRREIGVRMAIGATRGHIAVLILSQLARPVVLGLVVGATLTAALGAVLLATPAAEHIGSSVRLFDPVAYASGLLWIVAACTCAALVPALRAARINPVGALRQD